MRTRKDMRRDYHRVDADPCWENVQVLTTERVYQGGWRLRAVHWLLVGVLVRYIRDLNVEHIRQQIAPAVTPVPAAG